MTAIRPPTRRSPKAPSNQRPEVSSRTSAGCSSRCRETIPAPCKPASLASPACHRRSRASPRSSSTNSTPKTYPAPSAPARSAMVWRLPERAMPRSSSQSRMASAPRPRSKALVGAGYFSRSAFQNAMRALGGGLAAKPARAPPAHAVLPAVRRQPRTRPRSPGLRGWRAGCVALGMGSRAAVPLTITPRSRPRSEPGPGGRWW